MAPSISAMKNIPHRYSTCHSNHSLFLNLVYYSLPSFEEPVNIKEENSTIMECSHIDCQEKGRLEPMWWEGPFPSGSAVIASCVHHPTGFDFPAHDSSTRISLRWTWILLLWKTIRKYLCWETSTPIICYLSMFYINPRGHPLRKSLPLPFTRSVLGKTIFFKVCDFRIK